MFELTLKQTHWLKFELTLKQTHNENGSVTRTKPQEIMVRSQPQRPTPLSDSPAAKNRFFNSMMLLFFVSLNFISKLIWKLLVTNPNAQGSIMNNGRALVGGWARWAMAHPLFEKLLNKGPFKNFFSNTSLVLAHPLSKCRRGPC